MNVLFAVGVFLVVVLAPLAAGAQQIPTPGEPPEEVKEWTWYLSFLVAAGAVGLVALLGLSYLRLSSRFFGREEPPTIPQRRRQAQFAGGLAAPAAPRVDQVGAASTTPPAPPAAQARTAAEQQPRPVGERSPAGERATEEAPAQKPAAGEPPAEAKTEAQAPARPAPEHVEPDQEVYERELQAQLDKGTERRVAEGRAKAAAVRAARSKASGPTTTEAKTEPQAEAKATREVTPAKTKPEESQPEQKEGTPAPAVEKGEAEKATETKSKEAGEVKEPATPQPTPEADAEEAEEPPAKVKAPRPKAEVKPSTEAPPAKTPPGADEDTFRRVLEDQLEKGLARPIAESRARAAAVKAAREKADAG
jgi:hypothetical protein